MKAIRLYIGLCMFLGFNALVSSQGVSIELSSKWVKGYDIFKKDSIIYFPELMITYRNISDTSFYFQKVSDGRYGLPSLPVAGLLQYPIEEFLNPNYFKRAKMHGDCTGEHYKVEIGGNLFSKGWIAINDTCNIEVEHEIDMINSALQNIYEYIYRENYEQMDTRDEFKLYYTISDMVPEVILTKYKDKFVFLKPGESYTDTYNLIGFKLLKGSFTFYVRPHLPPYVYIAPIWDSHQSQYVEGKALLPRIVGGYTLYSGNFYSNKITITF